MTDSTKTALDRMIEFAEKTGRKMTHEQGKYPTTGLYPVVDTKTELFIESKIDDSVIFVCYRDAKKIFSDYGNYSGMFFPVNLPHDTVISVRNKDILDKLNPFLRESPITKKYPSIRSKFVIKENDTLVAENMFRNEDLLKLMSETFKYMQKLTISLNEVKPDFIPLFQNRSLFSIMTIGEWIKDPAEIEKLFELAERFRKFIT
jgi:hypothetical protein